MDIKNLNIIINDGKSKRTMTEEDLGLIDLLNLKYKVYSKSRTWYGGYKELPESSLHIFIAFGSIFWYTHGAVTVVHMVKCKDLHKYVNNSFFRLGL